MYTENTSPGGPTECQGHTVLMLAVDLTALQREQLIWRAEENNGRREIANTLISLTSKILIQNSKAA